MKLNILRHRKSPLTSRRRTRMGFESLERRQLLSGLAITGPSSSQSPYLVPVAPAVDTISLLTVGDMVADAYPANDLGSPSPDYRMVGIPDGMGAFDNGDGTFTVLLNHELGSTAGVVRDHGSRGAFVSRWVIEKETLRVLEGDDLIKTLYVWDSATNAYVVGSAALNAMARLCSADLPEPTAFYNPATGRGTESRIFMNGEETTNGRAFAHIVTGPAAGTGWELPWTGKYAWENHVTSPHPQDKTIVMGLDDSSRTFTAEGATTPSEVYVWIGDKQSAGDDITRSGLRYGILNGLRVGLPGAYDANESTVVSGERFELVPLSDQTNNPTFQALQTESVDKSITQFRRVEDGAFDPTNPAVFYFVTTDQFAGNTRLWKLTFDDIENPEAGGVIEIAFDSPSAVPGEMFDNLTVNQNGDVLLQEDPGNQSYVAKVWQFDVSSSALIEVAQHDPARFGAAGIDLYPDAAYPQFPGVQGTRDEESSGMIDLSSILGEGYYLATVQAHASLSSLDAELVEAGQLLILNTHAVSANVVGGVLDVQGSLDDDSIKIERHGRRLEVYVDHELIAKFDARGVNALVVRGGYGDDHIRVDEDVHVPAILRGGRGDDRIKAGGGRTILIGDEGADRLRGRSQSDLLIGGTTTLDDDALLDVLAIWSSSQSYKKRVEALRDRLNAASVLDDGAVDVLMGQGAQDWFFASSNDELRDRNRSEFVN